MNRHVFITSSIITIFIFTILILFLKDKNKIALYLGIGLCIMIIVVLLTNNNKTLIPETLIPNARVVISFSTIPTRVRFLPEIIEKLKSQTLTPDIIYACIPYFSKRKNVKYEIPDNWKFEENVKIVRCQDYGPATKLLGCIPYEPDPDTMIITIDDDHTYHPETIYSRVYYAMKYPNACLSAYGLNNNLIPIKCFKNMNITTSPIVSYIEGFGAPLYRRKHITEEMLDFFQNKLSYECFMSDDLTISTWLQMQDVPLIVICKIPIGERVDEIDINDALRFENRNYVYEICKKEMEKLKNTTDFITTKSYFFITDKYDSNLFVKELPNFDKTYYKDIKAGDSICIRTYQLPSFINEVFIYLKVPIILITTDADESIPSDIWQKYNGRMSFKSSIKLPTPKINFNEFLSDNRLISWYSTNLEDKHKNHKLISLPLGIDLHTDYRKENKSVYGQEKLLKDIRQQLQPLSKRNITVYANFHHNNSSSRYKDILGEDRKSIYNNNKDNKLIYFEPIHISRKDCWLAHGNHSFVMSPHGNGLDCHRTWEALVLGNIPIVKTSPINSVYENLPVIIVSDWSEITLSNLYKWKKDVISQSYNMEKLTTTYWRKQFKTSLVKN